MKKVFISCDMEGISGDAGWSEVEKGCEGYEHFREVMTEEVKAACEGVSGFADEITVRDAHWTARNIIHERLPEGVKLIRVFNGHLDSMMFGLDESYAFSALLGYHSAGGTGFNPLAHTMTTRIDEMRLNGRIIGEPTVSVYTSMLYGVPVAYIAGDRGAVEEVQALNGSIVGTVTKEGFGASVITEHPETVRKAIRRDIASAAVICGKSRDRLMVELPDEFNIEIRYKEHDEAYRMSQYPGARLDGAKTVEFFTHDFREVLRLIRFCA